MSLMARTVPKERVLGPVRRMGRSLCSLARRLDRSPEWARIVKGMLEMPEKGLKLGNLRRPGTELSACCLPFPYPCPHPCVGMLLTFGISDVLYEWVYDEVGDEEQQQGCGVRGRCPRHQRGPHDGAGGWSVFFLVKERGWAEMSGRYVRCEACILGYQAHD